MMYWLIKTVRGINSRQSLDKGQILISQKNIFTNFVINAGVLGMQRQNGSQRKRELQCSWAILLDPTSACNLHCTPDAGRLNTRQTESFV